MLFVWEPIWIYTFIKNEGLKIFWCFRNKTVMDQYVRSFHFVSFLLKILFPSTFCELYAYNLRFFCFMLWLVSVLTSATTQKHNFCGRFSSFFWVWPSLHIFLVNLSVSKLSIRPKLTSSLNITFRRYSNWRVTANSVQFVLVLIKMGMQKIAFSYTLFLEESYCTNRAFLVDLFRRIKFWYTEVIHGTVSTECGEMILSYWWKYHKRSLYNWWAFGQLRNLYRHPPTPLTGLFKDLYDVVTHSPVTVEQNGSSQLTSWRTTAIDPFLALSPHLIRTALGQMSESRAQTTTSDQ